MPWIQSFGSIAPRQYEQSIVKARATAVKMIENRHVGSKVYIFEKANSKNWKEMIEKWTEDQYVRWTYDKKYGTVYQAIFKNGKIKR